MYGRVSQKGAEIISVPSIPALPDLRQRDEMEITDVLEFWIDAQNDHHTVVGSYKSVESMWFILASPPFYLKKVVRRKLDDPKSVVKSWERDELNG
jgi:hypothetical protein